MDSEQRGGCYKNSVILCEQIRQVGEDYWKLLVENGLLADMLQTSTLSLQSTNPYIELTDSNRNPDPAEIEFKKQIQGQSKNLPLNISIQVLTCNFNCRNPNSILTHQMEVSEAASACQTLLHLHQERVS